MALTPDIADKIKLLEEKYAAMGQDIQSYLEGLLHADYLTYWDYVHIDTLLSLQNPRTSFPDETVFIVYHQITELYFKLCLHEIRQIAERESGNAAYFKEKIRRINSYINALIVSFKIMENGMEKEQFLKFRMALLPASGFQSAQYRMIEIGCTDLINLIDKDERQKLVAETSSAETLFSHLYWKKGATELVTNKKTLTLRQFEKKYSDKLLDMATKYRDKNIWKKYSALPDTDKSDEELVNELRRMDTNFNIAWCLVHYKSAARYLQKKPEDIAATGGTNWQKYLPPRFQNIIFFPDLWTETEKTEWGKQEFRAS